MCEKAWFGESVMNYDNILGKQKYIFGRLISLSNRLQVIGDRYLSGDDITIRQWLFTLAAAQFGDTPPTLSEVSQIMCSSHQNAKQIALKLEEKGFMSITSDIEDGRAIRLLLTEKYYIFWDKRQGEVKKFLTELFKDLSLDEVDVLCDCLNKLYQGVLKMEKSLKGYNEKVY